MPLSSPSPDERPDNAVAGRDRELIRVHEVTMRYPVGDASVVVLDHLSLTVDRGERVAIVGPSGSGKTTLLLLLAGLDRPTAGSVSVDGAPLETLDSDALADFRRDQLGIVFQSFHLVPSLSALDNVALPLEIAGRAGARASAATLLERVGLAHRGNHLPGQLSGGEQQRVAIARALVHRPALLLADEPTGNLDDHTRGRVADLLFDLSADRAAAMVLVTHDLEFAARCDRVIRLHDGRLSSAGDAGGGGAADRLAAS